MNATSMRHKGKTWLESHDSWRFDTLRVQPAIGNAGAATRRKRATIADLPRVFG
jgi:hypothetical protein